MTLVNPPFVPDVPTSTLVATVAGVTVATTDLITTLVTTSTVVYKLVVSNDDAKVMLRVKLDKMTVVLVIAAAV